MSADFPIDDQIELRRNGFVANQGNARIADAELESDGELPFEAGALR